MPIGNVFSTPGTSHVVQYATLADLRAAGPPQPQNPLRDYYVAITEGYDFPGDGGGAVYVWRTNNTTIGSTYYFTDDGAGLVVIPDNAPNTNGAWVQDVGSEWVDGKTLGLTISVLKSGLNINSRLNAAFNAVVNFFLNSAVNVAQKDYGIDLVSGSAATLYAGNADYPAQIPSIRMLPSIDGAPGGLLTAGVQSSYTPLVGGRYEGGQIGINAATAFNSGAGLLQGLANLTPAPPGREVIRISDCLLSGFFVVNANSHPGRIIFERCSISAYWGIVNPDYPVDAEFIDCTFTVYTGFAVPSGGAIQGYRDITLRNCSFGSTGDSTGYFQCTGVLRADAPTVESFSAKGQALGSGAIQTSPSVTSVSPISGTVYTNAGNLPMTVRIPVTFSPTSTAAATLAVAIGPSSTPAVVTTDSEPAGLLSGSVRSIEFHVPAGYYYSLTATNATINEGVIIS